MRPVLLPQWVAKDIVLGNSIVMVSASLASGLNAAGGRIVAPIDGGVFGYGAEVFGDGLTATPALTGFNILNGPTFQKKLGMEQDEYLVNVTPYTSAILSHWTKLNGLQFGKPPIVNYVPLSPEEQPENLRYYLCNLLMFPTVFNSAWSLSEWLALARKYASSADVRMALDTWKTSPIGIDCAGIDAEATEPEPGTFALCGRLASRKRYDLTAEILDTTFKTGTSLRWRVSTFGADVKKLDDLECQYPFIDGHRNLSRKDYYGLLGRTSAFLCCASNESYGLSWLEKIYAGQIGIIWDRPWARCMLPNYPFLVSGTVEAVAMCKRAAGPDADAMRAELGPIRDFIRAEHNTADAAQRFFARAESAIRARSVFR